MPTKRETTIAVYMTPVNIWHEPIARPMPLTGNAVPIPVLDYLEKLAKISAFHRRGAMGLTLETVVPATLQTGSV